MPVSSPARPAPRCTRRALSWLAALLPALAGAQPAELLLREVPSVFAASGFEQSASDAPSSVSVLTAADIERFGWRTLAEALGSLRGFHTLHDHAYETVGVRGLLRPGDWNGRILLRVDGHRVNDNVYGQAPLGHDAVVDLGAVERIEVVRGPGSSLYGASAVFAVVDVTTRRGRDHRGGWLAQARAGSQGTRALHLGGGGRRGDAEGALSLSLLERDGVRGLALPTGVSSGADAEHAHRLHGTLRWGGWSLQGLASHWRKQVPTGAYGTTLSDPRNVQAQERHWARLGYEGDPAPATRLRLGASLDRYRYRGDYRYAGEDGGFTNHDLGEGTWARAEAVLEQRLDAHTRLVAGLEHQRELRIRQANFDRTVHLDDRRRGHGSGAFVQLEHGFTPALRLNAGLRHDHHGGAGGSTSPRLGLIWQPAEDHALKLLHGTAFRAPNAFERWYEDGGQSQRANPLLRPERIRSQEAVWEARWGARLQSTLSLFRNRLHGLIDAVADEDSGLLQYRNQGTVNTRGAEAQLDARLGAGLEGRLSATWQHSRLQDAAQPLSNSPQRQLKAALLWRPAPGATLALESRSTSAVHALDGSRLPGATRLNATLAGPLGATGWRGSVSLFNALDHRWQQPAGPEHAPLTALPHPGRVLLLRLERAL